MITISLAYAGVDEGFRLRFPSSSTENSRTLLEVLYQNPRVDKIEISEVSSNVYNLGGYLKKVDIWNPDNQEKLETLGRTLQTMDRDSCLKFEGVLDANGRDGTVLIKMPQTKPYLSAAYFISYNQPCE